MIKVKKLNCFDYQKIKKMISYLGQNSIDKKFTNAIIKEPANVINGLMPLKFKFKPESYILSDDNEILGLITLSFTYGNPYKIKIKNLVFKQDYYTVGKQLIDYVVSEYGAKGANSFSVYIDNSYDELCQLFTKGCGFRQCSYENLWKLDNYKPKTNKKANFKACQNSDTINVSELYNSELNNLYKPSMERCPSEFKEPFMNGLYSNYKNRYVMRSQNGIIAYMSITTNDNSNYIINLSLNDGYNFDYDEIINFAISEISAKNNRFYAFIKQRQYTKTSDKFEQYLHHRNLDCIQTQCVFVKDFYRPIKDNESIIKVFSFNENRILTN